jgi:hypothetical protein
MPGGDADRGAGPALVHAHEGLARAADAGLGARAALVAEPLQADLAERVGQLPAGLVVGHRRQQRHRGPRGHGADGGRLRAQQGGQAGPAGAREDGVDVDHGDRGVGAEPGRGAGHVAVQQGVADHDDACRAHATPRPDGGARRRPVGPLARGRGDGRGQPGVDRRAHGVQQHQVHLLDHRGAGRGHREGLVRQLGERVGARAGEGPHVQPVLARPFGRGQHVGAAPAGGSTTRTSPARPWAPTWRAKTSSGP